jgi:predicted ATPase/DNA-binding SARP family transcriptional activator
MTYPIEIRLVGPFEVAVAGRPVDVSGSKQHGLLALLALRRGRVVGVNDLIDALWGEELPAAPRNALQHHVARLRAVLGQEAIVASDDGYALVEAAVDASRFEELLGEARVAMREGDAAAAAESIAVALDLWRGPPLNGLTDTPWFSVQARRLEALRVDGLEEQFEAALALGEHREIVSALRTAVEENPFRERLWVQLMLALYRSGRQVDALDTFQEVRGVLAENLGLEPGPDLQRLQAAVFAHEPAIAADRVVSRRGNLPTPTTSFVDRERELADVVGLLRQHRLVTLTGPPGVGKSRLALEAVRSLESESRGGVWQVDLARAGGAAGVVRLVAQVVGARGADPLARVIARLRDAEAILLFDACEHVLEEAARVASAVLAGCRDVRILATSREVLHLAGESRLHVQPLPLPPPGSADAAGSPAVQLFAARAQAARPGFELTPDAARLAAEITRRVDGLPLAIELAAARVNVLGLVELLSIVERRVPLLDERAAAEPRRSTLRGLVEWSYEMLHTDEKTLLHHVAVHRAGASRASLLAMAAKHRLDEATVIYLLGALVDKSIVSVSFPDGEARYDLLDTVRDYALERLAEAGGLAAARDAHAEYFATLAEDARTGLRALEWQTWMRRLELEHDNLWAALTYAREAPHPPAAARLGSGLGWYFGIAERVSEGRAFVEAALASADDAPLPLRVEMLAYVCYLATEEGDLKTAIEAGERGLALAAAVDAPWETAMVRLALAFAYDGAGPYERAVALAEEARRRFDELGDSWGAASSAVTGALGAFRGGDISTATALIAEGVRLHSDYDVGAIPAALLEALLAERRGDAEAAADAYRRALGRSERVGFTEHASFALSGLGSIAFADGNLREAEARYRRAVTVAEAASAPWLLAHAKARLAQVLAAVGDVEAAATLYRGVIAWSEEPRQHEAREALFIALVGSPWTAALLGLAELADARGDAGVADELRARAGLVLA